MIRTLSMVAVVVTHALAQSGFPIETQQRNAREPATRTSQASGGLAAMPPTQHAVVDRDAASALGGDGTTNTGPTSTRSLVLPSAFRATMGNGSNSFPHSHANMRYQQVFLGSEIGGVQTWTELSFRLDDKHGGPAQTQNIEVILGDTTKNTGTMTATFDDNYRHKTPAVFQGMLNLPAHSGGGNTNSWGVSVKFNRPIQWFGGDVNLIVEIINRSSSSQRYFLDMCNKTAGATTTRVFAMSSDAKTGFVAAGEGLVMRLRDDKAGTYTTYGTSCYSKQNVTILPKAFATKMGNTRNTFPHAEHDMRYQQVFPGSEITETQRWTQLCLRLDETHGGPAQNQTIELSLGDTPLDHTNLTTDFEGNFRTKLAVFKGTLSLPAHTGGGKTDSWGVCMKFTRPVQWVASDKISLLVEVINRSTSSKAHFLDACSSPAAECTTTRVYAFDADAKIATQQFRNSGLVMRLSGDSVAMQLTNAGTPAYGGAFAVRLSNAPANKPAVLWLGRRTATSLGPAFPGCSAYATFLLYPLAVVATNSAGAATATIAIPDDVGLRCAKFANQWLVLDTSLSPPIVFSNGGEGVVGGL